MNRGCCYLVAVAAFFVLFSASDGKPIDSSVKHSIEIRVIVDKLAFGNWMDDLTPATASNEDRVVSTTYQMDTYIKSLFVGVNAIFKELNSDGINLDARLVDIEYVTEETISTDVYNESHVSSDKVLKTFKLWLSKQNYPTTDHTLLLTGWDLSDGQSAQIRGVANVGTMCRGLSSLSVVEVARSGSAVLVLAHELGHSLSLKHDGDKNSCSQNSQYVMDSVRSETSTKSFRFSECSKSALKTFLEGLHDTVGGSCLSDTQTPEVKGKQLGEIYDPDTICRMTVGPQSSFGRLFYGPGGTDYSKICLSIWCLEKSLSYTSVVGSDGFLCGNGKRCSLGVCMESSDVSAKVSDTCPYGNTPADALDSQSQSCTDLRSCYSENFARQCCASCEAARTDIAGCEFGDRASWCATMSSSNCYSSDEVCCDTCKKQETSIPGCKYGDRSLQCSSFIQEDRSRCALNAEVCCGSCSDSGPSNAAATTAAPVEATTTLPPSTTAAPVEATPTPPPSTTAASVEATSTLPPSTTAAPVEATSTPPPSTTAAPVEATSTPPPSTTAAPVEATTTPPPSTTAASVEATSTPPPSTTAAPVEATSTPPPSTTAAPVEATSTPPPSTTAAPVEPTTTPLQPETTQDVTCVDSIPSCWGQIVFTGRNYLCYIRSNRRTCCDTCREIRNAGIPGCEYGDKNTNCPAFVARNVNRCKRNSEVCCASCATFNRQG